jgi:RNA polymerase sigma factor (sigma-70 family)
MIDISERYKSVEKIFYMVAHEFSNDSHEIDDLVQIASLHWLRTIDQYDELKSALTTWTYIIAKGAIIREWQRRNRKRRMPTLGKKIFSIDESTLGTMEEPLDRESLDKIWAYIDYRFDPRTADMLHQIFEHGEKQVDVAAERGLTKQRIIQIINVALADIREWAETK